MESIKIKDLTIELLKEKHKIKMKASGCSMLPFFREGDEFIIEQQNDYKIGDILVFRNEEAFVVHRLHKIASGSLLLWGDFNRNPDVLIPKEFVVGKAILVVREFKTINLTSVFYTILGKAVVYLSPLSHQVLFFGVIGVQKIRKLLA